MRDTTTKRQTIKDPTEIGMRADAAFPGVDDGAPPFAAADVEEDEPARKLSETQIMWEI